MTRYVLALLAKLRELQQKVRLKWTGAHLTRPTGMPYWESNVPVEVKSVDTTVGTTTEFTVVIREPGADQDTEIKGNYVVVGGSDDSITVNGVSVDADDIDAIVHPGFPKVGLELRFEYQTVTVTAQDGVQKVDHAIELRTQVNLWQMLF